MSDMEYPEQGLGDGEGLGDGLGDGLGEGLGRLLGDKSQSSSMPSRPQYGSSQRVRYSNLFGSTVSHL